MIQFLFQENKLYFILIFWVMVGILAGPLAYLIIPAHMVFLFKKEEWVLVILGLWLLFTLSDSRQFVFSFAQNTKAIALLILGSFVLTDSNSKFGTYFLMPFVSFFLLAALAGLQSPVLFDSYSKLISYILLLIVVPWLVNWGLLKYRMYFIVHLVLFGSLILSAGLVMRIVSPGFVMFLGDRFSGLLGNPNGLGIFAFMFLVLVTFIFKHHSYLFSKNEKLIVLALIFISLILSGSRGGLFAALIFLMGYFLFQRSVTLGFVLMSLTLISYQLILANLDEIATALGLETFLRVETLKTGSGRLVAQEFALHQIQKNYWFGKGFGYAEYIMNLYQEDFIGTEHQGNVHNSYLTVWLHTGLIGLFAFCYGWWVNFKRAAAGSPIIWALFFGMILSTSVESWLSASLNPFTIQLVIILCLAGNPLFYPDYESVSLPAQGQEKI